MAEWSRDGSGMIWNSGISLKMIDLTRALMLSSAPMMKRKILIILSNRLSPLQNQVAGIGLRRKGKHLQQRPLRLSRGRRGMMKCGKTRGQEWNSRPVFVFSAVPAQAAKACRVLRCWRRRAGLKCKTNTYPKSEFVWMASIIVWHS